MPTPSFHDVQARDKMWEETVATSPATRSGTYSSPTITPDRFTASTRVTEDEADFWSFARLQKPTTPVNKDSRNPVDAFLLDRLEDSRLTFADRAEATRLVRRAYYDTIGLPPTYDVIRKFESAENSQVAFEKLVDELLSDPGFGERWARVWLDLARYADSNGYEDDHFRPRAFTYRDFVTWAMNNDLPYDLFVQWQLAGDQLEPENSMAVAATGFLAASPINVFIPQESERMDELDDIVSTMSRSMLGLTVGCARCHDHMYDPIPTHDYYQLVAVFRNTKRDRVFMVPDRGKEHIAATKELKKLRDEVFDMLLDSVRENKLQAINDFSEEDRELLRQPIDPDNPEQARLLALCMRCLMIDGDDIEEQTMALPKDEQRFAELAQRIEELSASVPVAPPTGLCVTDGKAEPFHVLPNGDLKRKTDKVQPGFITAVTAARPAWSEDTWKSWLPNTSKNKYPREALAVWMTDTEHGAGNLLARVVVNRIWQHYFGRGIVATPSDFGAQGQEPTHPELLEWLACELVEKDWSLKHIHRLILTSAAYQQSSRVSDEQSLAASTDPENELLWRQNSKRLTAEMIRDSMLVGGGNLNRRMYGRGIVPNIPTAAILHGRQPIEVTWPMMKITDPASYRRSLYIVTKRTMAVPLMKLFDAPDGSNSCEIRTTTTVPTQSLAIWNSPFVRTQCHIAAKSVLKDLSDSQKETPTEIIRAGYQRLLQRDPTDLEVQSCLSLFQRDQFQLVRFETETDKPDSAPHFAATLELCHVLMLTNEFVYLN